MVTITDQGEDDIGSGQGLGEGQGMVPGHIRVLAALQDAHRAGNRDRPRQNRPLAAILKQGLGNRIALIAIV